MIKSKTGILEKKGKPVTLNNEGIVTKATKTPFEGEKEDDYIILEKVKPKTKDSILTEMRKEMRIWGGSKIRDWVGLKKREGEVIEEVFRFPGRKNRNNFFKSLKKLKVKESSKKIVKNYLKRIFSGTKN